MSKLTYEARKIKNKLSAVFIAHKSIQVNEKKEPSGSAKRPLRI